MERNGVVYVSSSVTKVDYRRLKLEKHRGVRPDLEEAIKLFQERIRKRYLKQINMLNKDVYNNGFASMALCCLLIDTFYQFEHGVEKTTQNNICYVDFLKNHMGDIFDTQEKAQRFYEDIRCGILHSAQTKKGSRLSSDAQVDAVECIENTLNSPISVDVKKMEEKLVQYFNNYCNRIRIDNTCQSNFVKKMKKMFKEDN